MASAASNDAESDLYGTVGYQAPEVPQRGASIASDLYTVARTLAMLSIEFAGFQDEKRYAASLPPVQDVPAFQRYESFHRFLQKATAADPELRFQSAAEMAEQLVGVLRQIVATDGGSPASAPSTLFSGELGALADDNPWQQLPVPAVDPNDAAAGVLATVALVGADQRQALLASTSRSPELSLNMARWAIEDGEFETARQELDSEEARESGWRAAWWRAVLHMAEGRPADGLSFFAAVAAELPGELAPKVAMAACYEQAAARTRRSHRPSSARLPPRRRTCMPPRGTTDWWRRRTRGMPAPASDWPGSTCAWETGRKLPCTAQDPEVVERLGRCPDHAVPSALCRPAGRSADRR